MATILTINKTGFGSFFKTAQRTSKMTPARSRVLSFRKKTREKCFSEEPKSKKVFKNIIIILLGSLVSSGVLYLYQVNDLTNKGYEMKEIEHQIVELREVNEKNKIKEVELRSMYNIEKTTKDLQLVSSENVSYLELDGPMAMK